MKLECGESCGQYWVLYVKLKARSSTIKGAKLGV